MNQKGFANIISIIVIAIFIGAVGYFVFVKKSEPATQQANNSSPTKTTQVTKSSTPTLKNEIAGWKTYENPKYGIEFQYPQNWIILENSFGGASKLNVVSGPDGEVYDISPPFLVIVLPESANNTFTFPNPSTSNVTVAGISGIKYEYKFKENPETAIVLPFGQYKILLGTKKPYENIFNQIITTFKFAESTR